MEKPIEEIDNDLLKDCEEQMNTLGIIEESAGWEFPSDVEQENEDE